jgi:hypothetical protein
MTVIALIVIVLLVQEKKQRFNPLTEDEFKKSIKKHSSRIFTVLNIELISGDRCLRWRTCLKYYKYKTVTNKEGRAEGIPIPYIVHIETNWRWISKELIGERIICGIIGKDMYAQEYKPEEIGMDNG